MYNPTAQRLEELGTRVTPKRKLSLDPTLGLETTCQLVPFQCSISVWPTPLLLAYPPAAQTLVAETAPTLPRPMLPDPATLGLETTCQLVPFQCSISVCPTPLLLA